MGVEVEFQGKYHLLYQEDQVVEVEDLVDPLDKEVQVHLDKEMLELQIVI